MKRKKAKIKETFANNLREKRRNCGFTQVKLAEKAGISTHYLAMVELARYIPSVETIERLANALNVEIYELFIQSPAMELKKLKDEIIANIENIVRKTVDESFEQERKRMGNNMWLNRKTRK